MGFNEKFNYYFENKKNKPNESHLYDVLCSFLNENPDIIKNKDFEDAISGIPSPRVYASEGITCSSEDYDMFLGSIIVEEKNKNTVNDGRNYTFRV